MNAKAKLKEYLAANCFGKTASMVQQTTNMLQYLSSVKECPDDTPLTRSDLLQKGAAIADATLKNAFLNPKEAIATKMDAFNTALVAVMTKAVGIVNQVQSIEAALARASYYKEKISAAILAIRSSMAQTSGSDLTPSETQRHLKTAKEKYENLATPDGAAIRNASEPLVFAVTRVKEATSAVLTLSNELYQNEAQFAPVREVLHEIQNGTAGVLAELLNDWQTRSVIRCQTQPNRWFCKPN